MLKILLQHTFLLQIRAINNSEYKVTNIIYKNSMADQAAL